MTEYEKSQVVLPKLRLLLVQYSRGLMTLEEYAAEVVKVYQEVK